MKNFTGFPGKMQFTSLPNFFFSNLLPHINDINELKITLYVLGALYRKKGYPRFVSFNELLSDKSLITSLNKSTEPPTETLQAALEMAISRGSLLHNALENDGKTDDIYLLNDEANRRTLDRIKSGKVPLPGLKSAKDQTDTELKELPDIYTLYEQNIGMLTPIIAEELKETERLYPENWIKEAVKAAVTQNKRSWKYIAAILERWSTEGRSNGAYQRRTAKKEDPDKYIKGKYGHIIGR
jgi:DnaD/phage-associated family protein